MIHSDPAVVSIPRLLNHFARRSIKKPRFVASKTWTDQRRLDLFDSILAGIPLGNILIWQTSPKNQDWRDAPITTRALGDGLRPVPTEGPLVQYLLDGYQRISALLSALSPPVLRSPRFAPQQYGQPDDAGNHWGIFFDPESVRFVVGTRNEGLLPLWKVLAPAELFHYRQSLSEREGAERLIVETERLATAIQAFRMSVVTITTDDLDLAMKAYQRSR